MNLDEVLLAVACAPLYVAACDRSAANQPATEPRSAASASVNVVARPPAASAPSLVPVPGGSATAAPSDPCETVCLRSRELMCRERQSCPALCREMLESEACRSELVSAFRCFGNEPTSHWECGDEGIASIKDGFCDAAQARFVSCMSHAARPP